MKKNLIKLLSLALVIALACSLFAACGEKAEPATTTTTTTTDNSNTSSNAGSTTPAPAATTPARDDIIIATANEPPTMAPFLHNAVAGGYMNILTHNTLLRNNIETLEMEPQLIESWEVLDDHTWQFKLREGVKFHDGEILNAEDVKASMEYAREQQSYTSTYSNFWESIEVIDDLTFNVTTKEVYAKTLIDMGSHYVLPKKLIDEGHDFNADPVGTGPYKFVKWTLGDKVEFEAFEDYYEGAPAIKHLTYRIIPEGSSRTIALEAGEIDFIVEVDNNDLPRLESDDGITVINQTGTSFNFFVINNEKPPFDNQDFRHALNCAVNKDALVQVALNGAGTGNYTQSPVVFPGHASEIPDKYDVELAKQYLEKSGVDPKTVNFSCICSDDVKRRCGEVIQANLQEIGITLNLESMDLATYLSTASEGNFEACIGGYTSSNMMSFMEGKFTSKSIGGANWTRTNDPHIDELYDKATKTLDDAARNEILTELANYVNEICPQVPTYGANVTRAYNSNLQGIAVSASGTLRWQYVSWGE